MPKLCEINYSHVECMSAIHGYYKFLTKLYLNESDVLEPPVEGWPDITTSTMQGLGKTNQVVSLLRHLPYIREPSSGMQRIQPAADCYFANWQDIGRFLSQDSSQAENQRVVTEGLSLFKSFLLKL